MCQIVKKNQNVFNNWFEDEKLTYLTRKIQEYTWANTPSFYRQASYNTIQKIQEHTWANTPSFYRQGSYNVIQKWRFPPNEAIWCNLIDLSEKE